MLGATVMPHVVYLHSALVQSRLKEDSFSCPTGQYIKKLRHAHYELIDVLAAMNGAWLVNSAMIIMAAAVFAHAGRPVVTIEQAHETLKPLLGNLSATAVCDCVAVLRAFVVDGRNHGGPGDSGRLPGRQDEHFPPPLPDDAAGHLP